MTNRPEQLTVVLVALYRYQNLTMRSMHALLERIDGVKPYTVFVNNYDTNLAQVPTAKEEELFVRHIVDLNPKLVGISILSPYVPIAKRLTRLIKDNTSALVAWGGVHATISPETCIEDADVVCVGEGEGAITDLVTHLRDKKDYLHIENLWVRNGDHVVKNPMRPLIQDLDSLPSPSYGNDSFLFIGSDRATRTDPTLQDNYLLIQASRGCLFSCSYCLNSSLRKLFKNSGPYYRVRSVDSIIEEMKAQLKMSGNTRKYVYFIDEIFADDEAWLDEFEQLYTKEIGLPFLVQYNPKSISSTILSKLNRAGLQTVNFGIQTGSDHIRNRIFSRPGKNDEIVDVAKKIADYGIKAKYDLILDNPYDTEETLTNTIDVLLQLPKPLFFNLYSLQYYPGLPLTQKALEDGHIQVEDVGIDRVMENTTRNWAFVPRLFPYTKKHTLQNIIWLIAWNHLSDRIARYGVFGDSLGSRFCLIYMNLKASVLGKILGAGGFVWKHPWISKWTSYFTNGLKYVLKGDMKTLYVKIRKRIFTQKRPVERLTR